MRWTLISGDYPPDAGGVADYTRGLALALARAGDEVRVWSPTANPARDAGVELHRLRGWRVRWNETPEPGRILLQYVPHGLGWKGMNVPFCRRLYRERGRRPWVIFHEVVFPRQPGQPLRHRLLAETNRYMAATVRRAAERCFVTIPAWGELLRELAPGTGANEWLPIFSNLPTAVDAAAAAAARERYFAGPSRPVLGHFGRYHGRERNLIVDALREVLRLAAPPPVLLIGPGGEALQAELRREFPAATVAATGYLEAGDAAAAIAAADVLLQPYPDGVSSRRGTAIAALALGRTLVTTDGHLTDAVWRGGGAAVLVPVESARRGAALAAAALELLADAGRRRRLEAGAARLYRGTFAIEHTVRRLRET